MNRPGGRLRGAGAGDRAESLAIPAPARVRVAFVLENFFLGGTELNAVRTAERLHGCDFDVQVISFVNDGPLRDRYERAGISIATYPLRGLVSLSSMAAIRSIAAHLRRERIDIVHCHDRYGDFVGAIAGRLAGIPVVIVSKRWSESTWKHRLTSAIAFRLGHAVLANSVSVADALAAQDHVSQRKVFLIPNFLTEDAFQAPDESALAAWREELSLPAEAEVVGMVASFRPVKNQELLLRAAALMRSRRPRLRVVLVGDGESREALTSLVRALGISDITRFAGVRPPTPGMQHLFDVSVLCSRNEGSPNAVIEAMAAGKPVVGTDVPGIRDVVIHGATGLLVPSGSAPDLAAAIDAILNDASLATRLGTHGREVARAQYHESVVLGRLTAEYRRLLQASRK